MLVYKPKQHSKQYPGNFIYIEMTYQNLV